MINDLLKIIIEHKEDRQAHQADSQKQFQFGVHEQFKSQKL